MIVANSWVVLSFPNLMGGKSRLLIIARKKWFQSLSRELSCLISVLKHLNQQIPLTFFASRHPPSKGTRGYERIGQRFFRNEFISR
jgi:hypothetical protein